VYFFEQTEFLLKRVFDEVPEENEPEYTNILRNNHLASQLFSI